MLFIATVLYVLYRSAVNKKLFKSDAEVHAKVSS